MQGIGDTLREARMRQKIDISEVEAKTKIRAKYLRALENEEFDLLPGSTFVRSFLRTYAEFLGVDAHMLVEEYRSRYEPRGQDELTPFATQAPRGRERAGRSGGGGGPPRRRPGLGTIAGIAIAAVLVFLLVLGLTGGSGSDDNNGKKETAGQSKKRGSSGQQATTAPKKRKPRRVVLKVSPQEATYVCVDRGTGTPVSFEGTISAPTQWRGRHLRLNLGKTSAAVSVNGKRLDIPPGPSPVGYDLTPKAAKPLPVGERPCA